MSSEWNVWKYIVLIILCDEKNPTWLPHVVCLFVFFYFVCNLAWLILCNIFIHQKYLNGHLWTKSNVFVVVVAFYMCNCKQQQQHGCKIIQNDFHILIRVVWRWIKQENKCIKSNVVVVVVRRKKDVCLSVCMCVDVMMIIFIMMLLLLKFKSGESWRRIKNEIKKCIQCRSLDH